MSARALQRRLEALEYRRSGLLTLACFANPGESEEAAMARTWPKDGPPAGARVLLLRWQE